MTDRNKWLKWIIDYKKNLEIMNKLNTQPVMEFIENHRSMRVYPKVSKLSQ